MAWTQLVDTADDAARRWHKLVGEVFVERHGVDVATGHRHYLMRQTHALHRIVLSFGYRLILRMGVGLRARDSETLPLPAGDVRAALVDLRLEAAVHLGDEVARLRDLERAP